MKTVGKFWPIILIVLMAGIFFWPVWRQGKLPIPADALVGLYHPYRDYFSNRFPQGVPYKNYILTDPVLQQYPWRWLIFKGPALPRQGRALSHLRENPYNFSGTPLLANIQAGAFYPLNIIFFIINNFSMAWTVFIMLQPILAAAFMFLWLVNRGLGRVAAVFGGFVWAFSSFNLVWMEWGNIGHAGLWLPLALLAIDKIAGKKEEGRRKKALWHGVFQFSLVSSLLAGHWQVTLYLLAAVAIYIIVVKRPGPAAARPGLNRFSVFLVHCFFFVVLTSFQWIPALRFMAASNREVEQQNVLSREGFFIKPKQLVQLVAPDFFGNPATGNYRGEWNYSEQVIYIGMIGLVLAVGGAVTKQKNLLGLQGFGLALVLAGLLLAVRNPIAEIPYRLNIPIWSDFQPTRLSYFITFGLAILSAIGFDQLINQKFTIKRMPTAVTTVGLGLFGLLVVSSKFGMTDKIVSQRNLILPAMLWGAFGTLSLANRRFSRFVACCLLLVAIFDLFRFGWKFTPFSPPEYLYPVTTAIKFLQENLGEGERYMTLDRRILPPNANIMYKLESIEGYDPIYSQDYARLITRMETGNPQDSPANFGRIVRPGNFGSPVAKELGVKYVLALNEIEDTRMAKVFQEGETRIYLLKSGD